MNTNKIAVKDGIGRYVNPYDKNEPGWNWIAFEAHANQTQFSINAPNGDYTDADFGKGRYHGAVTCEKSNTGYKWVKINKIDYEQGKEDALGRRMLNTRRYRRWLGNKVKEETVEEAAEKHLETLKGVYYRQDGHKKLFIEGAQWQADRLNAVIAESVII